MLLKATLAQKYRHSTLGYVWNVVPTILIVLYFLLMDANANVGANGLPKSIGYAWGMVLFQTFIQTFFEGRLFLRQNLSAFTRQRLDIQAFLIAGSAEALLNACVKTLPLWFVAYWANLPFGTTWFMTFFIHASVAILAYGLGLCLAPMSVLNKDLDSVVLFLPFLILGITPVFQSSNQTGILGLLFSLNPLSYFLEANAACFQAVGIVPNWGFFTAISLSLLSLFLGWRFIKLSLPHVAERYIA